jgi:hypothetical protein
MFQHHRTINSKKNTAAVNNSGKSETLSKKFPSKYFNRMVNYIIYELWFNGISKPMSYP